VWSGDAPTPFQSMLLASGIPQEVEVHTVGVRGIRVTGRRVLNQDRARLWQDDAVCPWRQHGVWDVGPDGAPRLLRPDYFVACNGKRVDFGRDFLRPFTNRFTAAVRAAAPRTLVIVQTEINLRIPRWEKGDAGTIAFSPHWYDPLPLVLKKLQRFIAYDALHGKVLLGARAIRRGVAAQIGMLRAQAREELGGVPFILGETGVPMDLRNRSSLRGSPGPRLRAADRIMRGLEDTLASSCWWNYAADNDSVHGDQWNGEDFSLFTADPRGLARGDVEHGRALQALVRPYPRTVAGQLLSLRFSRRTGSFRFSFRHDPAVSEPTEVFLPRLQYPAGYAVRVSDGTFRSDPGRQLLFYVHGLEQDVHVVSIRRKPG